jgi:hypothetical protein
MRWSERREYGEMAYSGWLRVVAAGAGAMESVAMPAALLPWDRGMISAWRLSNHSRYFLAGFGVMQLGAVWGMLRLCRRYFVERWARVGWVIGTLVLGPWALIYFGGTRHKPALVRCAQCGGKRTVGATTCAQCRAPVVPPQRNGTEIFGVL